LFSSARSPSFGRASKVKFKIGKRPFRKAKQLSEFLAAMTFMTPSVNELSDGQRACERLEAFQRQKPIQSLVFALACFGFGIWHGFERGGWKVGVGGGIFWSIVTTISIYQLHNQKRQATKDIAFLADLKSKYGDSVYSEIQKCPHSLFYRLFQKRFPPFNRRAVRLP
jgi:hypothetical protein